MTYNPSIPQPNDLLSDSQGDILQNFSAANTSFGINHYPFDNATVNNGKHKYVSLPPQVSSPATASNELALFTKTLSSGIALFLTRNNSTSFDVQLTTSSIQQPLSANNGMTFLPGGLLLQWGRFDPNSTILVSFPVPFSAVPYSVQLTMSVDNNSTFRPPSVSTGSLTANGFTYEGSVNTHINPIFWVAIGPKP